MAVQIRYADFSERKSNTLKLFENVEDWACWACLNPNEALAMEADELAESDYIDDKTVCIPSLEGDHDDASTSFEVLSSFNSSTNLVEIESISSKAVKVDAGACHSQSNRRGLKYFFAAHYLGPTFFVSNNSAHVTMENNGLDDDSVDCMRQFAGFVFPSFDDRDMIEIYGKESRRLCIESRCLHHPKAVASEAYSLKHNKSDPDSPDNLWSPNKDNHYLKTKKRSDRLNGEPLNSDHVALQRQLRKGRRNKMDFAFGTIHFILFACQNDAVYSASGGRGVHVAQPKAPQFFFFACVTSRDYGMEMANSFLEEMRTMYETEIGLQKVAEAIHSKCEQPTKNDRASGRVTKVEKDKDGVTFGKPENFFIDY